MIFCPHGGRRGSGGADIREEERAVKEECFLSILAAIDFVEQHFQVSMEKPQVICSYATKNNQCIGKRCPFSK